MQFIAEIMPVSCTWPGLEYPQNCYHHRHIYTAVMQTEGTPQTAHLVCRYICAQLSNVLPKIFNEECPQAWLHLIAEWQ